MRLIDRSSIARAILYAALAALEAIAVATTALPAGAAGLQDAPTAARRRSLAAPITWALPVVVPADMDARLRSLVPAAAVPEMPANVDAVGAAPPAVATEPPLTPPPTQHAQAPRAADPAQPASSTWHVASIKRALKLRPEQEQYWLPVEAVLHDIERAQRLAAGREQYVRPSAIRPAIMSIDPQNLQRLTTAAFPLIMSLDEAQKREARALARSMGLENVAAAI